MKSIKKGLKKIVFIGLKKAVWTLIYINTFYHAGKRFYNNQKEEFKEGYNNSS